MKTEVAMGYFKVCIFIYTSAGFILNK